MLLGRRSAARGRDRGLRREEQEIDRDNLSIRFGLPVVANALPILTRADLPTKTNVTLAPPRPSSVAAPRPPCPRCHRAAPARARSWATRLREARPRPWRRCWGSSSRGGALARSADREALNRGQAGRDDLPVAGGSAFPVPWQTPAHEPATHLRPPVPSGDLARRPRRARRAQRRVLGLLAPRPLPAGGSPALGELQLALTTAGGAKEVVRLDFVRNENKEVVAWTQTLGVVRRNTSVPATSAVTLTSTDGEVTTTPTTTTLTVSLDASGAPTTRAGRAQGANGPPESLLTGAARKDATAPAWLPGAPVPPWEQAV